MTSTPSANAVEARPVILGASSAPAARATTQQSRSRRRPPFWTPTRKISVAFFIAVGLVSAMLLMALLQMRGAGLKTKSNPIDLQELVK